MLRPEWPNVRRRGNRGQEKCNSREDDERSLHDASFV